MEAVFALKMVSKHNLSQEIIDDVLSFSNSIHKSKLELIGYQLEKKFYEENNGIKKVTQNIRVIDNNTGRKLSIFIILKSL